MKKKTKQAKQIEFEIIMFDHTRSRNLNVRAFQINFNKNIEQIMRKFQEKKQRNADSKQKKNK